ncbi:MAG: helix-turn-helix transcriptional regulator [Bacillota bacterium]|nr:helix-turn-helix transcriptional regulator [Bacillota bacterium]
MTELEQLAVASGVSLAELARRCGMSRASLSRVLRGEEVPTAFRSAALADQLGISHARFVALLAAAVARRAWERSGRAAV